MTNGDSKGRLFLSDTHTKNTFFFLLTIKYIIFYILKKVFQKFHNMLWCDITWWHHFNVTMTSFVYRCAAARFLSFPQVGMGLCEKNRNNTSLVFSGDMTIPTQGSTVPEGNKAPPPLFLLNIGPEGWDFPGTTEQQWSIIFLTYQFSIGQCTV